MSTALETALDKQVGIVDRGQKAFVEVGQALTNIRDNRLYRKTILPGWNKPCTFEEFCKATWGYARRHCYRLIEASEVVESVSHGTQKNSPGVPSERVSRELKNVPAAERQEVLEEAAKGTAKGKVTAKAVKEVVEKRKKTELKIDVAARGYHGAMDEVGNPIKHKHVAEAFSRAVELETLKNKVLALARELKDIDPVIGVHIDRQQIEADLRAVAANLRFGIPHAICPYCEGKKCEHCKQAGWVHARLYENIPDSVKK